MSNATLTPDAIAALDAIQTADDGLTADELRVRCFTAWKDNGLFGYVRTEGEVDALLAGLERFGWIRPRPSEAGFAPAWFATKTGKGVVGHG